MTPETKKVLKIVAVITGVVLVVTVATILIVKKIQRDRAAKEQAQADGDTTGSASPSKAVATSSGVPLTSGAQTTSSFQGRTFTQMEVEKMQSMLLTLGAIWSRPDVVAAIRDTGGVDGKIGTGFKTAYDLAIQYHLITDLDQLYNEATK